MKGQAKATDAARALLAAMRGKRPRVPQWIREMAEARDRKPVTEGARRRRCADVLDDTRLYDLAVRQKIPDMVHCRDEFSYPNDLDCWIVLKTAKLCECPAYSKPRHV